MATVLGTSQLEKLAANLPPKLLQVNGECEDIYFVDFIFITIYKY